MEYRTILVHADASTHAVGRVKLAAQVANRMQAHLVGVATTGISRFVCPDRSSAGTGKIIAGYLDPVYADASRALDQFEAVARASGVASIGRLLVSDLADDGLARHAACADLVVLSQDDPHESTSDVVFNLPEYVVLNCARPVLIAPYASGEYKVGRNVLIAWNGSKEATSAMTSAIPLVRGADNVIVAMLDPEPQDAPAGIAPAADIVAYLARHQVRAITLTVPGAAHAGEALLSLVAELDCDLLVMGCYGHTRFRELLLGGATRAVLRSMSVPVLMAQ